MKKPRSEGMAHVIASKAKSFAYWQSRKREEDGLAGQMAQGLTDMLDSKDRVAARRASLEQQAAPIGLRDSGTGPTPERARKAQDSQTEIRGGVGGGYKAIGPVEAYAGKWNEDQQMAFAKFAYESMIIPQQRTTINYDATGGGNAHDRIGGIGAAQDWQREVFNRHHWVRSHLTINSAYVLHALTGDLTHEATGRQFSFEDIGRKVFPYLRDRATAKGIGIGRFLGACDELLQLYRERHLLEIENRRLVDGR